MPEGGVPFGRLPHVDEVEGDRDLVTEAGLLFEAASYLQRGIEADIELRTGLPGPWFETVIRLYRSGSRCVRMNEMAEQVSFPPSSFSRLIDRMEAGGLVERAPDPTHRRATLLTLTALGKEKAAEAIAIHEPIARRRFADLLTNEELDALEAITRKIRDANHSPRATRSSTGSR